MAKTLLQLIVVAALGGSVDARAQCRPAQADARLSVNEVRARVLNDGALFYRAGPTDGPNAEYIVPQSEGNASPLFGGSIIVGGLVDDSIRVAGSRYAAREFWPGPVQHMPSDTLACDPYDRIFEITRSDIEELNRDVLSPNVAEWPWQWGAPVVDGDGNPDNYAPLQGDRPALRGDQMLWWVMNDAAGEHLSSKGGPIGLEIRASAYAFDTAGDLDHATFFDLELRTDVDVEDAYLGIWMDGDLGDFADDFLGSDSLLHLGYIYNADETDGSGGFGYGSPPPAVGTVFIKGPDGSGNGLDDDRDGLVDEVGEELGMSSFVCGRKSFEAQNGQQFYYALQGRLRDGSPERLGGDYWDARDPAQPET
ncbi:MAG: hypothetical protein HKN29_12480, partial [Rhodothermales bacterium]|nr:hypothetical protein [Rhodothermales bacterium]